MLRDTDADWNGIAGEPFYGVTADPGMFRSSLDAGKLDHFWQSGRAEIGTLLGELRHLFGDFQPKTGIDFGCGVGRLTQAMAEHLDQVVGIDVAEAMLEEAMRHAPQNCRFVRDIPDGEYDWINSAIVFQHIHPENGFTILRRLLEALTPSGAVSIQLTAYKTGSAMTFPYEGLTATFWDGETIRPLIESPHPSGTMMMYDYDLNRTMALLHSHGIDRTMLIHTDHGGCHGVYILGRRG